MKKHLIYTAAHQQMSKRAIIIPVNKERHERYIHIFKSYQTLATSSKTVCNVAAAPSPKQSISAGVISKSKSKSKRRKKVELRRALQRYSARTGQDQG